MKILITGGAGFVGSSLAIQLKEKYTSYSIIAFDNLKRRGSELNLIDFHKIGIEFVHGDIRNYEDLASVGAFDVLIEASAEPSVIAGLNSDPTYVINNNLVFLQLAGFIQLIKLTRQNLLKKNRVFLLQKINMSLGFQHSEFQKI